jgi:dolichol-phosphate mannosyltransferase
VSERFRAHEPPGAHKLNNRIHRIVQNGNARRIAKFTLVGAWGFAVNMFFLWFLTDIAGLYYLLSSILAIEISLINNFALNDLWTWRDRGKAGKAEYFKRMLRYQITAGASMLANLVVLWVLTELFGFYYLASNIFGILCGSALNFVVNDRWTFSRRNSKPQA